MLGCPILLRCQSTFFFSPIHSLTDVLPLQPLAHLQILPLIILSHCHQSLNSPVSCILGLSFTRSHTFTLICLLYHSLPLLDTHSLTHPLNNLLTHSVFLTHSSTHFFIHSFLLPLFHSLTHIDLPNHTLTHPHTQSFIQSFFLSLLPCQYLSSPVYQRHLFLSFLSPVSSLNVPPFASLPRFLSVSIF